MTEGRNSLSKQRHLAKPLSLIVDLSWAGLLQYIDSGSYRNKQLLSEQVQLWTFSVGTFVGRIIEACLLDPLCVNSHVWTDTGHSLQFVHCMIHLDCTRQNICFPAHAILQTKLFG